MGKPGKKSWEKDSWIDLLTTAIICCFSDQLSGVPNDCFLWIICSKKQILPRISSWGLLEISGWPFHTGTIFEAYFINPHYNFLKFNFSHFTRHAGLIFARNPKIFLFKNVMDRGLRKNLIFVKRQIASKTFGKLIRYDTIRYFISGGYYA